MTSEPTGLTIEDVRRYLQRISDEAEEMMRAFDPQQLLEWADTNISDNAPFHVSARIKKNGVHTGAASLLLMKEDVLQAGGVFGALAQKDAISDYSLEMRVHDVTIHGSDAATIEVTWHEHVAFRVPGSGPEGQATRLSIESEADCHHLVVRQDGQLKLGMTLCSVDVAFSTSE